mmetsp:Transcript_11492/g.18484  ORF Transcript_11492/g.18484 Transcript_11492/m.18484 type:complete len:229 (+) Transcript_11492:975-1661(+)
MHHRPVTLVDLFEDQLSVKAFWGPTNRNVSRVFHRLNRPVFIWLHRVSHPSGEIWKFWNMPQSEVTKIEIMPINCTQNRCRANCFRSTSPAGNSAHIRRATRTLNIPTILIGNSNRKTACANSTLYPNPRPARPVRMKNANPTIKSPDTSMICRRRLQLIRTRSCRSISACPPLRFARKTESQGTPNTQWLAEDQKTASAIQNQRLLKLRMSMSSKMVWLRSKVFTAL